MPLRKQIALFCVSGMIGFIVDAGIVQFMVSELDSNPYGARLISFLAAATTTWLFNRNFTFSDRHSGASKRRELIRYLIAMAGGFALNYGVYALAVWQMALVQSWPAIGVAAGSVAGGSVNFLTSKYWIFRPSPPARG